MLPLAVRPTRCDRARRVLGAWRMFRVRWMLRVIRLGRLVAALCVAHALDLFETSVHRKESPLGMAEGLRRRTQSSLQASMRPVHRRRGLLMASLTAPP